MYHLTLPLFHLDYRIVVLNAVAVGFARNAVGFARTTPLIHPTPRFHVSPDKIPNELHGDVVNIFDQVVCG